MFSLDTEGRVSSWNPDAQRVSGYPANEIRGRHFSVFYPSEVAASGYPDEELARAAEVGVHLDEGWRVRRDGSLFWSYIVIAVKRSEQGRIQGFTKVVRNDTDTNLRQQRSTQRFTDLLNLAPVGVALFDEHDQLQDVNQELGRLTGYSRSELLKMTATELLHPNERAEGIATHAGREYGPTGPSGAQQRTLLGRDGESTTCEIRYTPSVQDDGRHFWLVVFQDVTARSHQTELLRHQATHDSLTGLLNRRGIEQLLQRVTRNTAVLLCDIDNFKRINDSLGHAAGDELIMHVAQHLSSTHLPECTLARWSGDEFVIVCQDVTAAGGLQLLAEQVARTMRMTVPMRGHLIRTSAAVGAAMLPTESAAGEDLVRYADAAMFAAKEKGLGQVQLAEEKMLRHISDTMQLEEQLADALNTDSLVLYYQPIVDSARGIIAVEALVRWPHPKRGLLSPAVILPTAQQAGLVHELDRWVLRTAMAHAVDWPDTPDGAVQVSVNLDNHTASNAEFLSSINTTLAHSGLDPSRLVLEVTETSLIEPSPASRTAMGMLIDSGVRFAMDDFGTGYSSLARFKDLPIDSVKLDRQFIVGIETDEADRAIVRSAVDMAHATGRRCVAEGVETTIQFNLLNSRGMDAYQGFLFARPMPNDEFHALLTERDGPRTSSVTREPQRLSTSNPALVRPSANRKPPPASHGGP